MPEYLIADNDRPYTQEPWQETKDGQGRTLKPTRPARDEMEVSVRVDRQYLAKIRLPRAQATGPGRQVAIASACAKFALGEFLTPQIQVVEVEERFTPAREAMVTPEEKDEQGNVVRPESFTTAQGEVTEFSVTLRINSLHLQKVSITPAELAQPNWKQALATKVSLPEVFSLG